MCPRWISITAWPPLVKYVLIGYRGLFYHFLDMDTAPVPGRRAVDHRHGAAAGRRALRARPYFTGPTRSRTASAPSPRRSTATPTGWASPRPPLIGLGWTPEDGHSPYDWGGYNEATILYIIALGSTTHPVDPRRLARLAAGYRWGDFRSGQEHLGFAPLFGHQFSQVWLDLRGVRDDFMRERGHRLLRELAARHAGAARLRDRQPRRLAAATAARLWGLTACDGPVGRHVRPSTARERHFQTYAARGASFTEISRRRHHLPRGRGGSIAFAPELVVPTLHGDEGRLTATGCTAEYGFVDALNPTFTCRHEVQHGGSIPASAGSTSTTWASTRARSWR